MVKEKLCPVCMKELGDAEKLRKHMFESHPNDPITLRKYPQLKKRTSTGEVLDPWTRLQILEEDKKTVSDNRLFQIEQNIKMLEQNIDFMMKKSGIFKEDREDRVKEKESFSMKDMFDRIMMLRMIKAFEHSESKSEMDPFNTYDKIDSIFQRKLEEEYESTQPQDTDPLSMVIGQLISESVKKKSDLDQKPITNYTSSDSMKIEDLEKLSDEQIIEKIPTKYQDQIKDGRLEEQQVLVMAKNQFPELPESRFQRIWKKIKGE